MYKRTDDVWKIGVGPVFIRKSRSFNSESRIFNSKSRFFKIGK